MIYSISTSFHSAYLFSLLQEGEGMIREFLQTLKSLPLADMDEDRAMAEVKKLKDELSATNNSFILKILQQSTV